MKCLCGIPLLCELIAAAWAQQPRTRFPGFEEYRVREIFSARPTPPRLVQPIDRLFRTQIGLSAAKGPNFAGHYTIAQWGCGSGCTSMAIVDATNGNVYRSPFTRLAWGMPILVYEGEYAPNRDGLHPLAYKLESRLMIARGCPEYEGCASYFYEWTGSDFKLIQKVAAAPASTR